MKRPINPLTAGDYPLARGGRKLVNDEARFAARN
jgi:hypothetical protein